MLKSKWENHRYLWNSQNRHLDVKLAPYLDKYTTAIYEIPSIDILTRKIIEKHPS
jgi:hypothetical protein